MEVSDEASCAEATTYHILSNLQFEDGCYLIDEVLKPEVGESILDLGCGTGRTAMVLASRVGSSGRVLGVDPNKGRINVAQKTLARTGIKHASFLDGTSSNAIFQSPFDAVFSNYVLHWIEDHVSVLQDVYKCLRSGGRFALLVSADCPAIFASMFTRMTGKKNVAATLGLMYRKADYWNKVCAEVGFIVELCEDKTVPHSFPDVSAIWDYIKASVPSDLIELPTSTREDLLESTKLYVGEDSGQVNFGQEIVRALLRKP
jgi:trans-aconitate methyltransferase